MTTETAEMNESGNVENQSVLVDVPNTQQLPASSQDGAQIDSSTDVWQTSQIKIRTFLENSKTYTSEFISNNRQLLTTLGWTVLALLGLKLMLGALNALDSIPLVSPMLKLVGFVYVIRFVWRYLIREKDRQELMQQVNQTKSEVFGNPS